MPALHRGDEAMLLQLDQGFPCCVVGKTRFLRRDAHGHEQFSIIAALVEAEQSNQHVDGVAGQVAPRVATCDVMI